MLTALERQLDGGKGKDLLGRLEDKRVKQALPAEMELALLWALLQIGELEVEPKCLGTTRLPDAYSESVFPGHTTVVEITALDDASVSQEDDMRKIASRLCIAANRIRRGQGKHLHFHFGEESGYTVDGYVRRRKIDAGFAVTPQIEAQLADWLGASDQSPREPLQIQEGSTCLAVTWNSRPQSEHFNFTSTMPAITHSLTENSLFAALKSKSAQLRSTSFAGTRCLFLADAGSTLLRRLDDSDPLGRVVSGGRIITHFLSQENCGLDVVCVFSPYRARSSFSAAHDALNWRVTAFSRSGISIPMAGIEALVAVLPRPRFEGYQARSLQHQKSFATTARGCYVGTSIRSGPQKMTIKISARSLLDLLAGRVNQDQFMHSMGCRGDSGMTNMFELCLSRGEVISDIRIEHGTVDEDDDRLVVEFSQDPSVSKLKLGLSKG
jgi:hypothetical protein